MAEVRPQWFAPRELPDGCVPLAEVLIARGVFTERQVWERVRLLLQAGAVSAAWNAAYDLGWGVGALGVGLVVASLGVPAGFAAAAVEKALEPLPARLDVKAGRLYQPIRVAITGSSIAPGIFESLATLGREQSLARIDAAIERLRP